MGCVIPPMFNMSDDFNTQMMYAQMMSGGANGTTGGAAWKQPTTTTTQAADSTKAQGGGLGGALKWGLGAAAVTGAGTYFTNTSFTSPIVDGKFTDAFMTKFSGEYAAMQNGDKVTNFFKGLGSTKTPITAENYFGAMDSIDEFIRSGDVDDLTTEAKAMLKKKFNLSDVKKGTLETLHSNQLENMKGFVYDTHSQIGKLNTANNLNAMQALKNSLDDIDDGWKALGKGADSKLGKINFLKENAQALGIDADDYKKLLNKVDDVDVKDLDDIFKKYGTGNALKNRKANLGKEVTTIQKQMQKFATKWEKSGLFGVGGFKKGAGNSKVVGALDDAYKAMKKCKAGKYALIAGVAVAGLKLFDII